jgi:hypothetical protein
MQVWAYRFSAGQHREPLGFDIAGCVGVPIMDRATLGTRPLPNIQLQLLQEIPADRTARGTGENRSIATTVRPYQAALYWSWRSSSPQPTSAIALARCSFCSRFLTASDSTQTTWFSRMRRIVSLCRKSRRRSAMRAFRACSTGGESGLAGRMAQFPDVQLAKTGTINPPKARWLPRHRAAARLLPWPGPPAQQHSPACC